MKIRLVHMRALREDFKGHDKMCIPGAKTFFKRHGLDWDDFIRNGIDEEILAEINDGMANEVIRKAHEMGE